MPTTISERLDVLVELLDVLRLLLDESAADIPRRLPLGQLLRDPSTGWGTVADLMDPHYQARAFYGGPTGPNHGSPRGLLDIPGWQEMDNGAAAQAVEVSAYPDRYATFEPVAEKIIEA